MADFACSFVAPNGVQFLSLADPIDYSALFMPLVAVQDLVAPTVTLISPPLGNIGRFSTVVLRAADALRLLRVNLWVEYANGIAETIYARGIFMPAFSARSSVVTIVADKELEFTLARVGGWPRGALDFQIEPVDLGGNVSS